MRAHETMSHIGRLTAPEEQSDETKLQGDSRRDTRQAYAVRVLSDSDTWLEPEYTRMLPKSSIGHGVTHTCNLRETLCRSLHAGHALSHR
ncbi:MAG: IS66 family transposase [Planctomycetota bacterium]